MTTPVKTKPSNTSRPIQRALRRFFSQLWVEMFIGVLVIMSVGLTLVEFTFDPSTSGGLSRETFTQIAQINNYITWIFIVELSLRFIAAQKKRAFFSEFWLDIVAVIPLFRIFRSARALRLLRLIRVLRLFGLVSRLSSHFPSVIRRGLVEYIFVCGLLIITVIFGTGAILYLERGAVPATADDGAEQEAEFNFESALWFSIYSLFAGEPTPIIPRTIGGKLVAVFIMFMGLTIFAMFTGTVSAFMIDRFRREGDNVDWEDLKDHIIICGWNAKTEIIIEEFKASTKTKKIPIVLIAQLDPDGATVPEKIRDRIMVLDDDFTRISALEKAGVHRAHTCIVVADTSGNRSEQDADARTILAGLTVEKLNPDVYTCAELIHRSYGVHLKMGHVNEYVISGEYSAYMLAQSAMSRGLTGIFSELLTYTRGNEFYRLPLPSNWIGRTFTELLASLKESHDAILVAVCSADGELSVNPTSHEFQLGDEIVVISKGEIKFER